MAEYFRIRTFHDTYLAVYQPSGTLCAVDSRDLGKAFRSVLLLKDESLDDNVGVLFGDAPDAGFFVRPYAVGNKAIPVEMQPGVNPETVSFVHPGTQFYIACEPKKPTNHFANVAADRKGRSTWEAFRLEPIPYDLLSSSGQAFVDEFSSLNTPKRSLVDLYSQLGCDALASKADATSLSAIMELFESLGDNCEFGLVQRECKTEPLGLLRFGGGLGIRGLTSALREKFERVGRKESMMCDPHPSDDKQYNVKDRAYNLGYHTWRDEANVDPNIIIEEESIKLKYLKDKLIEDMEDCEKIFVFKRNEFIEEVHVIDLLAAMREFGNTTLLFVVKADADHPVGTVVKIFDGLLYGYIDRFAPYEAAWDISVPSWIRICRNAYALWQDIK